MIASRSSLSALLGLSFLLTCALCRRPWVSDAERWRAYHGGDDLNELAEVVFYCPVCASASSGNRFVW